MISDLNTGTIESESSRKFESDRIESDQSDSDPNHSSGYNSNGDPSNISQEDLEETNELDVQNINDPLVRFVYKYENELQLTVNYTVFCNFFKKNIFNLFICLANE